MKIIFLFLFLAIVGCSEKPQTTSVVGNGKWEVGFLFEFEGCRVYRFNDGRTVYFTNCRGSTEWDETCGKNQTCPQRVETK